MKKRMQTLCLALFAGVLAACGGDGPDKAVKTFYEEIFNGDASKAVELIYIPPEADRTEAERVKRKVAMLAEEKRKTLEEEGGVTFNTGEVSYTNADKTEAMVELIMKRKKGGNSETTKVPMIKTDKGWRIKID